VALSTDDAIILPLLVGEASGVFAGFCPSWFTVASPFFHDQEAKAGNVGRIRAGEACATAIVLATGWAISKQTGSSFALIASAAISAVFVVGYEYQIAHPSKQPDGPAPPGSPAGANKAAMLDWDNPT
jgi:hypothetical protein